MKKDYSHILFSVTSIIFLSFAGVVILHEASAAWTGPTGSPPSANTPTSLNTGSANQTKTGGLTLGSELWLGGGVRHLSQGAGNDWTVSNLADILTFKNGATSALTVNSAGNLTATGIICDSVGCIGGAGPVVESDPTVLLSVKDGVDWSELTGIPAGFADGVDDSGVGVIDWTSITNIPADINDGDDVGINLPSCAANEIPKFIGGVWACATDNSGVGSVDWSIITGVPAGFADGVDDTGITAETDPTVNTLAKTTLNCTIDQITKYNGAAWVCADGVNAVYAP